MSEQDPEQKKAARHKAAMEKQKAAVDAQKSVPPDCSSPDDR